MKIKFCGAAREVTGSCHLITLDDGYKILLDCGLYQGRNDAMAEFNEKWLFEPSEIDCLLLSHAHIDHTGRLPKLVKDGFNKTIYATHATRDLAGLMLLDSAKIQESDAAYDKRRAEKEGKEVVESKPLYTVEDARQTMRLFAGFDYDIWFKVRDNIEVMFTDAGHILGSASISLKITEGGKTTRLGFTADIGRPNRPILRDPQPMPPCDFLLCESTYGDRLHDAAPEETTRFQRIIEHTCVEKRGKLIIPAFSVGRTQEVVYILDKLVEAGKLPAIDVYVDSPLAVDATTVFVNHPECFDAEIHDYLVHDPNPFGFKNLTFIRDTEGSKRLNTSRKPCIIIASSGMANAGRVKHHIANNVEKTSTTILIVGYASPNTPAGQLRDGAKKLNLFDKDLQVRAEVEVMDSFSAHGDYKEILQMIGNQRDTCKNLFLVHGDYAVQKVFKNYLEDNGFARVEIPGLGDEVKIDANGTMTWLTETPQYEAIKTAFKPESEI
jgi:metallo-beta-lactamase family protein